MSINSKMNIFEDRAYTIAFTKMVDKYLGTKWLKPNQGKIIILGVLTALVMLVINSNVFPWLTERMDKYESVRVFMTVYLQGLLLSVLIISWLHITTIMKKLNNWKSKYNVNNYTHTRITLRDILNSINSEYKNLPSIIAIPFVNASLISILSIIYDVDTSTLVHIISIVIMACAFTMSDVYATYNVLDFDKKKFCIDVLHYIIASPEYAKYRPLCCSAILAMNSKGYIGKDNKLMYKLPKDMSSFKELTRGNIVIMGRKTFESLGSKPLKDRLNIVISSDEKYKNSIPKNKDLIFVKDPEYAIATALYALSTIKMYRMDSHDIWVIGGRQTYINCFPCTKNIYTTLVYDNTTGDTEIEIPTNDYMITYRSEIIEDNGYATRRINYARI